MPTLDYISAYTGEQIDNFNIRLTALENNILNTVYPVGSIYISVNGTNPGTIFGGTWSQIQDTFLLAAGSTYAAGSTGGEAEHTLNEDELPEIDSGTISWHGQENGTHVYRFSEGSKWYGTEISNKYKTTAATTGAYSQQLTGFRFGGGTAHNNMPPYLAVYVWKRTA